MSLPVRPGDVIDGKYRVDSILGEGGMGIVVAAHHLHLDERVAIKFLLPAALASPDVVNRFAREARAAVKIRSEHVARVIDVGTLDTGAPFMVMEYLEGGDLSKVLWTRGPLPIDEAVEYVLQACEAIAEAHALGIVHRDLKPANLFLVRRPDGTPSVKVLDFGISKVSSGTGPDLGMTKTTAVMGSPLYMSPEQMASARDVDARSDIWALGVILFELIAGRVPFAAESLPQLCAMILQQPAPPLRSLRPDAPAGLESAVARALATDRNRRYSNLAELASALGEFAPARARASVERIGRILQVSGTGGGAAVLGGTSPGASTTEGGWNNTRVPGAPSRTPLVAVGAVGALVVIGAVGWYWTAGRPVSSAAAGTPAVASSALLAQPSAPASAASAAVVIAAPSASVDTRPAAPPVATVQPAKIAAPRLPAPSPTAKVAAPPKPGANDFGDRK